MPPLLSGPVSGLATGLASAPASGLASAPASVLAAAPQQEVVPDEVQQGADATVRILGLELATLLTVCGAFVLGWVIVFLASLVVQAVLFRRKAIAARLRRLRNPLGLALGFGLARVALVTTAKQPAQEAPWFPMVSFLLVAALVGCLAWAAVRAVNVVEEQVLDRYREVGVNDRRERKVRTQTVLIRRILHAVIVVVAVAVILLTIPAVRSLGAGLLASAGLISVIAALAVQSTLTNVFAGVQLAFTDSIRVGDVVTMDATFGTVEDITLSNVVLKLWDGRRMVYPSSQFTTQPFENWTRVGSAVSGTVEMDVDWRVPMDDLRDRLKELLASTDLWDGRDASMQVTDAIGGMVRIRAVVSARTSGDLWDLRCLVREDLVNFIRHDHPEAIHAQRFGVLAAPSASEHPEHDDDGTASASGLPSGAGSAPAPSGSSPAGTSPAAGEKGAGGSGAGAGADDGAGAGAADRADRAGRGAGAGDRAGAGAGAGTPAAGEKGAATPGTSQAEAGGRATAHPPTAPLPRVDGHPAPRTGPHPTAPLARVGEDTSMYTGSIAAVERNREFAGPGEEAYAERKAQAEQHRAEEEGTADEKAGAEDKRAAEAKSRAGGSTKAAPHRDDEERGSQDQRGSQG